MTAAGKRALRGAPPADAVAIEGLVPFHDVDPLHIVWHGHYSKYLEVARTALFRRADVDGPELIALGFSQVVSHGEIRYVAPLRYGDRYRVTAWFLDIEQRVHVAYEVYNLSADTRAARARTELVTLSSEGDLLLETPKVIQDRIRAASRASEAE